MPSSSIGALLASFMLASNATTQIHFIDIKATADVEFGLLQLSMHASLT